MGYWTLLFLPPLLAYSSPWFGGGVSFSAHYLVVPFAALLAKRFGVTGVIAVALGGLAFVVGIGGPGWGAFGGSPALYLVALAVAAIVASPRPASEWLRWPERDAAANWLAFAAPLALLTGIGTGYLESPKGAESLRLSFGFGFSTLGYFVLFLMGARGARLGVLVLGLAAAGVLTWALALNGLLPRSRSMLYLYVNVLQPVHVLAALAAFSAGGALGALLRGRPLSWLWARPYATVLALLILWYGPEALSSIGVGLTGVPAIYLLQSPVALPIAAFMAGLLRGWRGVIFVSVAAPVVMLLGSLGSWLAAEFLDLGAGHAHVPIEAPFVAAAYGLLGARISAARRWPVELPVLRLPGYILLVLAAASAIAGEGGTLRLSLAGAFLVAACAALVFWNRLRRAMAGTAFEITPERWLGFTTLVCLAAALGANLQAAGESLKPFAILLVLLQAVYDPAAAQLRGFAGETMNIELLAAIALVFAIYLLGLAYALRGLVRTVPKILDDVRRIIAFVRAAAKRPARAERIAHSKKARRLVAAPGV